MNICVLYFFLLIGNLTLGQTKSNKILIDKLDEAYLQTTIKNGNKTNGFKLYEIILSNNPESFEAYNSRGLAYLENKNQELAIKDFLKSRVLNKNSHIPLYNLGFAKYKNEDYLKAIFYLDSALIINKKHTNSYYLKGCCYAKLNKSKLEIENYSLAIESDSLHFGSYKDRGLGYLHDKKYNLALLDFNKAIGINKKDHVLYLSKVDIYIKTNQLEKVLEMLNKAKELSKVPKIDFFYSYYYYQKKDLKKACECLKKAKDQKDKDAIELYPKICK